MRGSQPQKKMLFADQGDWLVVKMARPALPAPNQVSKTTSLPADIQHDAVDALLTHILLT